MTNLLSEARSILETAGYSTFVPRPDSLLAHFEDETVLGVLHVLPTAKAILAEWHNLQDEFLRTAGKLLIRDSTKSWNVYSLFLSPAPATPAEAAGLLAIEEDFRATRKLARAGLGTRSDIVLALAPLLPLQNMLSIALTDATTRVAERLGPADSPLRALLADVTPEDVVRALTRVE